MIYSRCISSAFVRSRGRLFEEYIVVPGNLLKIRTAPLHLLCTDSENLEEVV